MPAEKRGEKLTSSALVIQALLHLHDKLVCDLLQAFGADSEAVNNSADSSSLSLGEVFSRSHVGKCIKKKDV